MVTQQNCAADIRSLCNASSMSQKYAMLYAFSPGCHGSTSNITTPVQDIANFLLVRGPHAWLGHGWSGCSKVYEWPKELDGDYGVSAAERASVRACVSVRLSDMSSRRWCACCLPYLSLLSRLMLTHRLYACVHMRTGTARALQRDRAGERHFHARMDQIHGERADFPLASPAHFYIFSPLASPLPVDSFLNGQLFYAFAGQDGLQHLARHHHNEIEQCCCFGCAVQRTKARSMTLEGLQLLWCITVNFWLKKRAKC